MNYLLDGDAEEGKACRKGNEADQWIDKDICALRKTLINYSIYKLLILGGINIATTVLNNVIKGL